MAARDGVHPTALGLQAALQQVADRRRHLEWLGPFSRKRRQQLQAEYQRLIDLAMDARYVVWTDGRQVRVWATPEVRNG